MKTMLRTTVLILTLAANAVIAMGAPICCVVATDCCETTSEPDTPTESTAPCCTHCAPTSPDDAPMASALRCGCHDVDHAVLAHLDTPTHALAVVVERRSSADADLRDASTAPDARSVRSACAGRTPPLRL
jgi:hypothetical protein